jgi:sigma-B regulation protein RsbU (phosphoserine phosphatase)
VGVINLIGRKKGGLFTASDQKLLSAVASQIGAALENNRLIRESLEQERVTQEMQLAHDLQIKLLPTAEGFDPERIAARVTPADSVGGDFYHFFRIPGDRIGVMIGDVSGHGFPAALIMALSMSAATIYATEVQTPARVLQGMGEALMDELETTEMYLTLFYGVVDPERGELVYANAGHPHAFAIRSDGKYERLQAMDPPMGIAGAMEYQQRAVPWEAGKDLLLLFTDGLSDDVVAETRSAGEELLLRTAVEHRDRPVSEIVEALFDMERREWQGGVRVGDDRTAVGLRA